MKLLAISLLALTAAAPLTAQQMSKDTVRLADRVVTATRVDAVRGVTPTAVTVISGDELRARGVTFVIDALHDVPGIMVVPSGSYGSVTSVFLRGGESDYIKVLIDGVPINEPGGSVNLANLNTDNLDRIEIVRGPASVLYGSDAVSGVIQLFTKSGQKGASGGLSLWRGTFHNTLYDFEYTAPAGAYGLAFSASNFNSDGTYAFNSKYHNRVESWQLDHVSKQGLKLAFTGRYGDAKANYPTDYTGIAVDSNQFTTDKNLVLGVSGLGAVGKNGTLTVQGFASRQNSVFNNRPDSPGDSLDFGFSADRGSITSRRGGDARFDWSSEKTGSVVSLGGGYEREKEEQNSVTFQNFGTGAFADTGNFVADRHTVAGYAQAFLTPSQFLTIQLGTRLDDNSAFGNFFTWRAGAAFNRLNTRIWVSAGSAFKAPTFSELFATSAYEVGNKELDPERSTSVETGVAFKSNSGKRMITLGLFSQKFRDLIQYINAAPGATNYVNLGGAESRGIELSLALHPLKNVGVRGHWTWLHTEVTDTGAASSLTFMQGGELLRRPASSGEAVVNWDIWGLKTTSQVNFIGKRDDVDFRPYPTVRTTLPAYQTVDVSVSKPFGEQGAGKRGWELIFRGENLFKKVYEQVIAFPGRGRTLFIGARTHF